LLHPDAIIHAPAGLSTASAKEEKAVWRDALAAMPDLRHDVQEVLVDRDVEMARVVVTGTLSLPFGGVEGTGRSFRIDQAVITHSPPRWQGRRGVGDCRPRGPQGAGGRRLKPEPLGREDRDEQPSVPGLRVATGLAPLSGRVTDR